MTKLGTWKRTVLAATAVAVPMAGLFGGAALADPHRADIAARSTRVESHRVDAPSAALPTPVRHEATTYRATSDECVGSVCTKGVTATTPEVEVSEVGGPVETPTIEVGTGAVSAEVNLSEDSVGVAAFYGAIGTSYEVNPYGFMPRH